MHHACSVNRDHCSVYVDKETAVALQIQQNKHIGVLDMLVF